MAFDTLIKKFFPVIIGLVLAVIAYLQASGVVQLVSSSALATNPKELIESTLRGGPSTSAVQQRKPRSAQPVIARNPFDDTDLNPKPVVPEPTVEDLTPKKVDLSDPLAAAPCDGVKLHIVTESPDPEWSVALMQAGKEEKGSLRRVGDEVEGMQVAYIGFNRQEASPAVWMVKDNKLCQALLFTDEQAGKSTPAPRPSAAAKPEQEEKPAAPEPAKRRGAPKVPDEIAEKIEKVSDSEFNVDRAVIDNILENQATLMRSARIVPEKGADGKTVGIRLFGIRGDTLLGTLGLQNGDRLETINGFNMSSPEDALNAYARLRTANKLNVKITRRGKPMNIDFNIK